MRCMSFPIHTSMYDCTDTKRITYYHDPMDLLGMLSFPRSTTVAAAATADADAGAGASGNFDIT